MNPRPHGPKPRALPTALHPDLSCGFYFTLYLIFLQWFYKKIYKTNYVNCLTKYMYCPEHADFTPFYQWLIQQNLLSRQMQPYQRNQLYQCSRKPLVFNLPHLNCLSFQRLHLLIYYPCHHQQEPVYPVILQRPSAALYLRKVHPRLWQ